MTTAAILDLSFLERIFGEENVSDYYGSKRIDFPTERETFLLTRDDGNLGDYILRFPSCHLDDPSYHGAPSDYHVSVDFTTEKSFLEALRKVLKDWEFEMKEYEDEVTSILKDDGFFDDDEIEEHLYSTGEKTPDLSQYYENIEIELRFL